MTYYAIVNGCRRELTINVFTGDKIIHRDEAHNNARWIAKQENATRFEVHCENEEFHTIDIYEKIWGAYRRIKA